MWPVQTLTLLLCLTDEEQLFAQNNVKDPEVPTIEAPACVVDEAIEDALPLFQDC